MAPSESAARRAVPAFGPLFALALGGCGAYWDLPDDADPVRYDGCTEALNWYADCDLDGFGDPSAQPLVTDCAGNLTDADADAAGCGAAEVIPLASNQLDCKGDDPTITGRFGICPDQIGPGAVYDEVLEEWVPAAPTPAYAGLQLQDREYVATFPPSEPIASADALSSCTAWAGANVASDVHRGMARITTKSPELDAFLAQLQANGVTALWLDLSLDANTGEWNYEGDGTVPVDYDRCEDGNPELADFWPEINPNLVDPPEPGPRGTERLALVSRDGGWCWDAPGRVGLDPRSAMAFCQRPRPDPVLSAEVASGGGGKK